MVVAEIERSDKALFFRQAWVSGDDGDGLSFEVSPNLGSPHVIIRIEADGETRQYKMDMSMVVKYLANLTQEDTADGETIVLVAKP